MDYRNAQFERKPQGAIIIDGQEVAHTRQCVHCMRHFLSVRGSGMRRGFCMRCMGITCGNKKCDACIPAEAQLDHMEGRRTKYTELILDNGGV